MENLTLEYILLALLGMVIHILMKVANRGDKKNNKFSLKTWVQDRMNWVRLVLAVSSTVALMIMADDLANMLGVTLSDGSPANSVFAFGAGYLNHSLIRNVLKVFKKGETPA
jgi:hypothetical protein